MTTKYPMKNERVIRMGGRNQGKTDALENQLKRVKVEDAKAALYRAFLDLGGNVGKFTASDLALMAVLVADPDIQARFEAVFRRIREGESI